MSSPVIDFHFHPVDYDYYRPSAQKWIERSVKKSMEELIREFSTPESVLAYLDEHGVDYCVMLPELSYLTTGVYDNRKMAAFCKGQPRLIPFANINPFTVPEPARELERCVTELGMKGLKLYPTYQYFYPNDPILYPVYATAQRLGIPVMIHTGSSVFRGARLKYGDPIHVDDVAVDFPELPLLLVHGGRGFWYDRAFFLARLHPNVYLEIAGLPPQHLLDYFPELEKISDKVIFGSDFPGMPDIRRNIELIRNLPLKRSTVDKILGGNAARLLGILSR